MYRADYRPLSANNPDLGRIAILPWDTEIFGFPVADLELGNTHSIAANLRTFLDQLVTWTSEYQVELVSCFIPANDAILRILFAKIGFVCVDTTLQATKTMDAPSRSVPLDFAQADDLPELERIAETVFRFGRYHADGRFPRNLANHRYRIWVRNAFANLGPSSTIYVVRRSGRAVGFSHIEIENDNAHSMLTAVDPELQGSRIGKELLSMRNYDLARRKIHESYGRLSVRNSRMLNLYASFGYRFSLPLAIYHWHSTNAPHLLSYENLFLNPE